MLTGFFFEQKAEGGKQKAIEMIDQSELILFNIFLQSRQ
ncbi:hypothetical protein FHW36_101338 [Chitinophaga polysaccharea]|uniref:Uncharacterized protein n=1 Tax=Chitinophaga polysaccharea TaxID=1293035 RepID=A0A561Q214_9BACT|nr:hypothetical protein FHW36_101338 [Chitinophaga polysaccharea]